MNCYKLLRVLSSHYAERNNEPVNGFLIRLGQLSVALNQLFLIRMETFSRRWRAPTSQHIARVHLMFFKLCHVTQVNRIGPEFVIFLRTATDSYQLPKFQLI